MNKSIILMTLCVDRAACIAADHPYKQTKQ